MAAAWLGCWLDVAARAPTVKPGSRRLEDWRRRRAMAGRVPMRVCGVGVGAGVRLCALRSALPARRLPQYR
jgi:hypothetical protein